MTSKTVTISNPSGLHLRPAGVLSQLAMKFNSDIIIEAGDKKVVAKSVLNVMGAGIKTGDTVTIVCTGDDEEKAYLLFSSKVDTSQFADCSNCDSLEQLAKSLALVSGINRPSRNPFAVEKNSQ